MSRKRWIKRALAGFLALGSASGCKQQLFMEPGDYKDALLSSLPRGLENRPHDTLIPSVVDRLGPGPATVLDTDRPARLITLQECLAIALEQGNTGIQSSVNFGFKTDPAAQFTGRGVAGASDAVRVFAIDPAIAAAELERSISKFDVRWVNSMTWQKVDQPTAAQFLSFQNSRDSANFTSTLAKPLPTGGVAGITFSTDYSKFGQGATTIGNFVNPNYTPRLQFSLEQPLLRLFGVEVNQLTPSHPGSSLLNVQPSGGQGTEGILVSRIRLDQQKADFEIKMNYMLMNVEAAYWNLFAAYYNLYGQEEGLRQAYEGLRFIEIRVQTGNDPPQNEYQSRAQFERFRKQVYLAHGQVLDAERNLRGMLGLRSDDGTRLVPIDKPSEAPYTPDFYEAANDALANRPELLLIRQELKVQQLNLLLQKNLRQADLRTFLQYDVAGLGTRLDGREFVDLNQTIPGNAMASLGSNNFNSWTIGFRLDMPIGFRDANAAVREAQLNLAKTYYQLRDEELKTLEFLVNAWRRVTQAHVVIGAARAEREALQIYLGKIKEVIRIGKWDASYYQNYLTVQQQFAAVIAEEFRAVADYNTALAVFEFAKGTVQQYNHVTIGEGPLPAWVSKKAADHIRERTESALKLRERDLVPQPGGPGAIGGQVVGPPVGTALFDQLPPFAHKQPPVPDLPPPRQMDQKMLEPIPVPPGLDGQGTARPLPPIRTGLPLAGDPMLGKHGLHSTSVPAGPPAGATAPQYPPRLPAVAGLDPVSIPPVDQSVPTVSVPQQPSQGEFGPAGSVAPIRTLEPR